MSATATIDPDRALVEECQEQQQSEAAFQELYERHHRRVMALCHRLTRNAHDAQEATQETFAIVFQHLPRFRFKSVFEAWLCRIAANVCIDVLRHRRVRAALSLDAMLRSVDGDRPRGSLPDDRAPLPFEEPAHKELRNEVDRAVHGLSEKLREVIVLRYFDALSYEQIATRLGVPVGTVKSRMSRAHEALEHWLHPALFRHSA